MFDDLTQAATGAANKAQTAATSAAASAQEAATSAANTGQSAAQSAASSAQAAAASAQTAATEATNSAQAMAEAVAAEAQATAQQATAAAEEATASAQAAAQQATATAQAAAAQAASEAQVAAQQAITTANEAATSAQAAAESVAAEAQAAAQEGAAAAETAATEAQVAAEKAVAEAQTTAEAAAAQAQAAAQEAVASAEQAASEAAAVAQGTAQEALASAQAAVAQATATAEAKAAEAAAAAEKATAAAEAMAEEATAAAQAAAQEATAAAEQAAAQAQALATEAMATVQAAAAAAMTEAQAALQAAETAAQEAAAAAQAMAEEAVAAAQGIIDQAASELGESIDRLLAFGGLGDPIGRPHKDFLISQFTVYVGKNKLAPTEFMHDVIEITVDDSLYLPDMFTIHLHDKALKWVDADLLAVGAEVEIRAKAAAEQGEGAETERLLIKGEITALEPDFTDLGEPTLVIRGYDRAHRLHRGKQTRSFLQTTDSEIATKIAQEVGLQPQVEPTRVVHDYVFQNNQTNLEFLLERAQRIGYQLYVEDETLYFCAGEKDQGAGPELEWGRNLRTFRPRLTVVHQVNEVIVKGWDPKAKREIVGQATQGKLIPQVGASQNGGGGVVAQEAFKGSAQAVTVSYPVQNQDEAQAMAQALCDDINGEFIQAEGVCLGEPGLQAGKKVKISAVGDRFSGTYFVTSATHTYNAEIGYETVFSISGRQPNTLSHLLAETGVPQREQGVVVGLVTNNKDPDGLGRVKVKYPWLSESEESTWAKIAAPMAGPGRGFYYLPEVNDEVLVAFEQGDIHRPYVLGALWNSQDPPPKKNNEVVGGDGKVNQRIIHSRSGHQIILDDTAGGEKIEIIDRSGRNQVVINTADNSIEVTADAKVTVQAGGQSLILDNQAQSIQLQGGGRKLVMQGGQVQMT